MRKFKLEITATVVIDYDPSRYPSNMSPQEALALEIAQAADHPSEYLCTANMMSEVSGAVLMEAATAPHYAALEVAAASKEGGAEARSMPLQGVQRESVEMVRALEEIRQHAITPDANPHVTLGMVDAFAHMALVRANISRSLARARGVLPSGETAGNELGSEAGRH